MRAVPSVLANLGLALFVTATARAEDPCNADAKQFCAAVELGSGRVHDCLRENKDRLSVACRDRMAADDLKARKLVAEFGKACQRDTEALCAGLLPGGGRIIECLDEHQMDLSSSCRSEVSWISEARGKVLAVERACKADIERLCRGVAKESGPIVECLKANEAELSPGCNASDIRLALGASTIVDAVAELTREDRVKEALEILQGIDSVAFSRSQIILQFDDFQGFAGKANANRFLFNPQFVFGGRNEFALQFKVPVTMLFPDAAGAPAETGVGDVVTAFGWAFYLHGQIGQYLSLGLQSPTASAQALGAPWAVVPAYAIALGLARWLSLTVQLSWIRSFESGGYPQSSLLIPEPIFVVNLPGRSFLALDTKLGVNLIDGSFVPVMKGVAGLFLDRQKSVSISAWGQAGLTSQAQAQIFDFGIGSALAYFFDW